MTEQTKSEQPREVSRSEFLAALKKAAAGDPRCLLTVSGFRPADLKRYFGEEEGGE